MDLPTGHLEGVVILLLVAIGISIWWVGWIIDSTLRDIRELLGRLNNRFQARVKL
jgi:hypothetical protein